MRSAARRQDGFTLIELLVAMTIGTVVLLAAFSLVDMAINAQADTENRIDATQRGRGAMEQMTRGLRSQLCPSVGGTPIEVAEDNRVKFYSSLVSAQSGSTQLQKRVLTYEPIAGPRRGRLVERVYLNKGTEAAPVFNDTVGNDVPDRTNVIADHISPIGAATPVFRYSRFDPAVPAGSPAALIPLAAPVTGPNLRVIAQVRVAFDAWSVGLRRADRVHVPLDSRVQARFADPEDPSLSGRCRG